MRIGPRLMHRIEPHHDATDIETLRKLLQGAPGVVRVLSMQPHHKGGFSTSIDLDESLLDQFITHVDEAGWMSVL